MATTTTNFGLKKYEGTDLFNPLTFENPNSDDIDAAMFYNKQHNCVDATELTTGTVHALTKTDTDAPLFSFTATSVYHAGDTFTLNGTPVTALLTSGETLPEGAYVIGSRVLGFVSGGSLITFYIMKTTDLAPINRIIGNTDISGIADGTLTGAVDSMNDELEYRTLAFTPGVNYTTYTSIVRAYRDRIVLYFNGQNAQTIVPTGTSILGTISNWTYGVRQITGTIRDAAGENYIFALFGIDASGIVYISAPSSFPAGLFPNCMTISDTILL